MKPFISELKLKDTEEIKWRKALSSYLKRIYGQQQWSQFFDEKLASELDHIRNNANGKLAVDTLLDQNYTYYAYLEQLNVRLGNNTGLLRVDFTWYDTEYTLGTEGYKYKQRSLIFEKSSILYNIAVLLTTAARESVESDYKASISYLSKAVMCFSFLSENFLNSPSVDIQAENTQFLANLCHAEAQEMFTMKLINGPTAEKQASLISKLAFATYNLYDKCNTFLQKPEGGLSSYGEPKWSTIVTCKLNFFRSLSSFYHGLALEQQNKIGESIAFLKLAVNSVITAIPFRAWLNDFIDFEGFKETVEDKLKQLIKDNDYIYHDSIPQSVSVDVIKPMDAIKASTWPQQLEPFMDKVLKKCETLYKGIVPTEAYEKESIYSDQKDTLLRRELDASQTADFEYRSFMEYTNLNTLVRDLENRYKNGDIVGTFDLIIQNMRDNLTNWSRTVQQSRFKDITSPMRDITRKRKEISDVLATLPQDQMENVVKLKASLIEASKSDEKLFSLIRRYSEEIKLLDDSDKLWNNFNLFSTESSIQPSLLDVDDRKTEQIISKIKEIKQGAEDLRVLNDDRSEILSELKAKIIEDDITSLIITNKESSNELQELFTRELEKFSPLSSRIEATIFKQTSLINDIKIKLDDVFSISGLKDKAAEESNNEKKRKEFYDKLEMAATNFSIFTSDINRGLQFYDSLLRMSKELLQASQSNNTMQPGIAGQVPPRLPQQTYNEQPNQFSRSANLAAMPLDSQMASISLSSNSAVPSIPPRTYDIPQPPPYSSEAPPIPVPGAYAAMSNSYNVQPASSMAPMVPPKPLKQLSGTNSGTMAKRDQTAKEEAELQRNPTAFYDKSSVFHENLYSEYSG